MNSRRWIVLPLLLAAIVSLGVLVFSELSHGRLYQAGGYVRGAQELQQLTREVYALVLDAETGQRGYLLTGRSEYLEPYTLALQKINSRIERLRRHAQSTSPEQSQRIGAITQLIGQRLNELDIALTLYRERGTDAAQLLLQTDIGKNSMDRLSAEMESFNATQHARSGALWTRWEQDIQYSRFGMALSSAFNVFLLIAIYILSVRDMRQREATAASLMRNKESLEETVRVRTAEVSRAYRHLQSVQESEKARLARDIHDELGAILVSAKMDASWVEQRLQANAPQLAEKLHRLVEILDEGVQIKRRLIEELRPTLLDNLGLGAAIEWQTAEVCVRANLQAHISIPDEEPRWPSEVAIALFRIVQEALTNIVRYAEARNVWVSLDVPAEGVRLRIQDDGVGLPERAAGDSLSHGILGMRERVSGLGGTFELHSGAGAGTTIDVYVPVVHGMQTSETPRQEAAVQ